MAPRKTKEDSGIEDSKMILDYLLSQNRPYSAIEVSANLHNKISKTQAVKLLRDLHQNGEIEGKTVGKQIVYHAIQDPSKSATPEMIAAINQEIQTLQDELVTIKTDEKRVRSALAALEAKPRICDLQQQVHQLEEQRDTIQARVSKAQCDTVQIPAEERDKLEREWKQWQRHAAVRRRICRDLWGKCTEYLPDDLTSDLWESLGLEGVLQ